jgi:hypothetical protein
MVDNSFGTTLIQLGSQIFLRWIPKWRDWISELILDEICELLRWVIRENRDILQQIE